MTGWQIGKKVLEGIGPLWAMLVIIIMVMHKTSNNIKIDVLLAHTNYKIHP